VTRTAAASFDEVMARHGCVQKVREPKPEDAAPHETIAIVFDEGPLSRLTGALPAIRDGYELVEIYVRNTDGALFEPVFIGPFAFDGEIIAVARRRQPDDRPRIVGMMLAKDEADAIPEVLAQLHNALDALYYFAGDPATADAIVRHSPPGWARAIRDPGLPHADGLRQFLLEAARADAVTDADLRPMWVMSVQGDEIYHDDLRRHILHAHRARATMLNAQVATFLLHESQKDGWDWSQPLDRRLTHYIWDFQEHAGFVDFPWLHYLPAEHMRAHPRCVFPREWADPRSWPIRRHCPFRSPEQARARLEDRLRSTKAHPNGWQPHYKNYADVFVGDSAAGRPVRRYKGAFTEADRHPGLR